ncbi:DUF6434 domain-containing protein [Nitrospirillum sp. BR 11164]|uniref:DUF6434 domain-containing protein n=1 Tax=Nitrospirillum sp. BR 11164 TaxID=3104324 RepID=UPI002AFDD549|nr:DUF6434 domain-containing protein [Nitrospirillum sp. BR 11164]MEA1649881.1 DUF6434 domain-containing protein [Nitrospirillum sp. BR 11164]
MTFDWHADLITRDTPITPTYRGTQNVRRFFRRECGDHFKFGRPFMAWMKAAAHQAGGGWTMGDAADEWRRRDVAGG